MRWTQTLIPTLKETPSEAEAVSHILMLRAGMIRKLGSGVYSYLPLGTRSLNKITAIVREEMDNAGAVEVLMPAMWPIEILKESGRLEVFGDDVIRFTDRHEREGVLGPTHEEIVTSLVRDNMGSYRDIPKTLYQIQTKFRDEVRPRFGVLRTREFIMKDAYSFDADQEGLEESYQSMYDAYRRIFDRCGVEYVIVEAESGAMGGSRSEEFMVPSEIGDDKYVECSGCGYAANIERADIAMASSPGAESPRPEMHQVDTPGARTIEEVSEFLGVEPRQMIKTLIYRVDEQVTAALVRGDHEINENKLGHAFDTANVELAGAETIEEVTGAPVGFAGPVGLEDVQLIADQGIMQILDGVTGANVGDAHITGVVPGRDFEPDQIADIRVADDGDLCPKCGKPMTLSHGIEIGHVFQLGTKYSKSMGATFLDSDGKEREYVMGCYGIGINRIAAASIENYADENGIIWSPAIAPYEVVVMPLGSDNKEVTEAAEKAYESLLRDGIDVILDDRDESPGSKFKDADLIGFPIKIVVGKGYLNTGKLEIQVRKTGEQMEVLPAELDGKVAEIISELQQLR
ncbi:MAG: proline--tRNA ligase [Planctomycetes bacterium]|nr:proline--tRNA ligase [Planctomycetota bacterium]